MNLEQTEQRIKETAHRIANEINGTVTVNTYGVSIVKGNKKNWVDQYAGWDPEKIYCCQPVNDYELSVDMHMAQATYLMKTFNEEV
jgi:hypothetical protein